MKFGQLIEHHMIKNVIEKSYSRKVEILFLNLFLKIKNQVCLLINNLKFQTGFCYFIPSWVSSCHRGQELGFLFQFLHDFWKQMCLFLCFFNWSNFIAYLPLLREIVNWKELLKWNEKHFSSFLREFQQNK